MLTVKGVFTSIAIHNYTKGDCNLSYEAATSPLMQTIRVVHVVFCLIGVVASSLFVYVLLHRSSRNLHINLRVSLISLSIAALIACTQLLVIAIYSVILTVSMDDRCNAIIDSKTCALIRWPVILAIYSTLAGIICIAIERTIATVRYKTYEAHGSRMVSIILIIVQWSISFAISLTALFLRSDRGFVHYCTVYISHPKSAILSLSTMTVMEAFVLIYFGSLLNVNRRKQVNEFVNNALHTLTERYQLLENVRMIQTLIPSIMVHALLSILGLGALLGFALLHQQMSPSSVVHFAPYSELVLLVVPIYSIVAIFVAIKWNPQMRKAAKGALPGLFNVEEEETITTLDPPLLASRPSKEMELDSDRHFGLLVKMWNK